MFHKVVYTTYARFGGGFNIRLTANLPRNLLVKKILNRFRLDRIMVCGPAFLANPVGPVVKHRPHSRRRKHLLKHAIVDSRLHTWRCPMVSHIQHLPYCRIVLWPVSAYGVIHKTEVRVEN